MDRTYIRQLKGKQSRGQIIWWMLLLMLSGCGTVDEKDTMYIDTESVIQQLNASNNMKGEILCFILQQKKMAQTLEIKQEDFLEEKEQSHG